MTLHPVCRCTIHHITQTKFNISDKIVVCIGIANHTEVTGKPSNVYFWMSRNISVT